jgi:hypothetical protein
MNTRRCFRRCRGNERTAPDRARQLGKGTAFPFAMISPHEGRARDKYGSQGVGPTDSFYRVRDRQDGKIVYPTRSTLAGRMTNSQRPQERRQLMKHARSNVAGWHPSALLESLLLGPRRGRCRRRRCPAALPKRRPPHSAG